jgi:hypothetical protein
MMHEKKKEKRTEARQIPGRKTKSNKRIKQKPNFNSLAGNRTHDPCHPCHPCRPLPATATDCHTSPLQPPTTYKQLGLHILIRILILIHINKFIVHFIHHAVL